MHKYTVDGLAEAEATGAPLSAADAGASGAAKPQNLALYLYELKGVVVHSGTAFAGHYYSYIKVQIWQAVFGCLSSVSRLCCSCFGCVP